MIRPAIPADIPALTRLLLATCAHHGAIRPDIFRAGGLKYTESDLLAILSDESRPIFVYEEQGQVLGFCFCQWVEHRGSPVMTNRRELYIDDLCVDEPYQRRGIGEALTRHAIAVAKEGGCAFVTLNVWTGNESAIRFYEKMGLRPRKTTLELALEDISC